MSVIVAVLTGLAVALFVWAVARARRVGPLDPPDRRGDRRPPSLKRVSIVIAACVAGYAIGGPVGAALGLGAGSAARVFGERRAKKVSREALDEQLADSIGAVSSAMRAGLSVPQAFAYAASEAEDPLKMDLDLLVHDIQIGTPLDVAVRGWTDRVATDDAVLFSSAVELNRSVGGDLPIVLDQVGATIRDRVGAVREVRALTAQARLSGLILGLLPVGFFAFLWMTSRTEMQQAISTPAGIFSIALGLVMEVAAFLWIRKLLEVA